MARWWILVSAVVGFFAGMALPPLGERAAGGEAKPVEAKIETAAPPPPLSANPPMQDVGTLGTLVLPPIIIHGSRR